MPRLARECLETSFFHVMVQGINKEYIFKNERYIRKYLKIINEKLNDDIEIIAYCIMNNHAHLLIKAEKIEQLSKYMQKVNTNYAKYYNYMEGERVGYVFRDRFKTEPILDKRQLIQCVKYIHQNPVKANMVKNASEYEFSTYNFYLEKSKEQNDVFTREEINYICNNIDCEEDFLDIDRKIESTMNIAISIFLKKENVKLFEIFEKRDILKKLVQFLNKESKIKYAEIMKILDITRGTMYRLK